MGRWTQYDTDEYRLPPNFQRIAYDADEGVYTYRDTSDNSLWKGAPGNEFGELVRVSGPSSSAPTTGLDVEEGSPYDSSGNKHAYRQLLPFLLVVGIIMLFVYKYIFLPSFSPSIDCNEGERVYTIKQGDTCWSLGIDPTTTPTVDCARLHIGQNVCVPLPLS